MSNEAGADGVQYITAGFFATEQFDKGPNFEDEIRMYTTSAIAPVFIVHRLVHANLLGKGSKVILVTSESGSLTLRHKVEGGGNYGHHASKAAENMVGKLLSLDLNDKEIIVTMVHPGFMKTEMTKSVGFDEFYEDGGGVYSIRFFGPKRRQWLTFMTAVTPEEAAQTLSEFVDTLDMSKSGTYWAPRGAGDIGTAEKVLGKDLPKPLELPW
jgi:NAD(P)-dependent dehydrogenase (short-subunit alcohol dehydrogenase family)